MRAILLPAFAAALGLGFFAAPEAQARFNGAQVQAPSLVENVACVTRHVRTVRPNGRVVYRTVRDCGVRPGWYRPGPCRMIRERVVRPNGSVVYRTIRRCR
ncbi:hypothetical protein [Microvirga thermotolerans]|uniref:Uncharacterized protein n=1 Tax=Microvirga thermotolerans TaxID=2651334 RepID=A0A5P9JRM5_9HYPH|nr:hypothetical protein [Microvirga thermotolerans]QFU15267.1 hypothetical protein GDR74_02985 [Microvirga thermotolerans]